MKKLLVYTSILMGLALNASAGAKDGGAGSICEKDGKVSLADFCLKKLSRNRLELTEEIKEELVRTLEEVKPFYSGDLLSSEAFKKAIIGPRKQYLLVNRIPKGCHTFHEEDMVDGVDLHDLACTRGDNVYYVEKQLRKLSPKQFLLSLIHEGFHAYSQKNNLMMEHEDIAFLVRNIDLIMTKFVPARDRENTENIFTDLELRDLNDFDDVVYHALKSSSRSKYDMDSAGVFKYKSMDLVTENSRISTGTKIGCFNSRICRFNLKNTNITNSTILVYDANFEEDTFERNIENSTIRNSGVFLNGVHVSNLFGSKIIDSEVQVDQNYYSPRQLSDLTLAKLDISNKSSLVIKLRGYKPNHGILNLKMNSSSLSALFDSEKFGNIIQDITIDNSKVRFLAGGSSNSEFLNNSEVEAVHTISFPKDHAILAENSLFDDSTVKMEQDFYASNVRVNSSILNNPSELADVIIEDSEFSVSSGHLENVEVYRSKFEVNEVVKKPEAKVVLRDFELTYNNRIKDLSVFFKRSLELKNMHLILSGKGDYNQDGYLYFGNKTPETWSGRDRNYKIPQNGSLFEREGIYRVNSRKHLKKYKAK